jgi:hypothetical protein
MHLPTSSSSSSHLWRQQMAAAPHQGSLPAGGMAGQQRLHLTLIVMTIWLPLWPQPSALMPPPQLQQQQPLQRHRRPLLLDPKRLI